MSTSILNAPNPGSISQPSAGTRAFLELADDDAFQPIQTAYLSLLTVEDASTITQSEREAIGLRIATLERSQIVADFHLFRLLELGSDEAHIAAVTDFPNGGQVGDRLKAILEYADNLTCSARQGTPGVLAVLRSTGFDPDEIIVISKLITALSFQIRVMATVRALEDVA